MQKIFEIITGTLILAFIGVVLWQISDRQPVDKYTNQDDGLVEPDMHFNDKEDPVIPDGEGYPPWSGDKDNFDYHSSCTEDAKICPDGSVVNRVLPHCEFKPCQSDYEPVACTADAKQCPDGSYVGRVGPNCKFAACSNDEKTECSLLPVPENACNGGTFEGYSGTNCEFESCSTDSPEEFIIRYGENISNIEAYKNDCANKGGEFNGCVSSCPLSSDACADVCSMVCTGRIKEGWKEDSFEPDFQEVVCSPESKLAEVCTADYTPVCGLVDVQCVTTPCDPIPQTFGNACGACSQGNVTSYTAGACEEEPFAM